MRILTFALIIMAEASQALAQPSMTTCKEPSAAPTPSPTRTYHELWCQRVFEIAKLRTPAAGTGPKLGIRGPIENFIDVGTGNWRAFLLYAQARSAAVDAGAVEEARTDKQIGAPAGTGSTNLVSKGAVPGILGFAVENGALTQSTSGTTVTLRGNMVGWLDLLKNQDFIAAYQDGSGFVRGLRRVSYSLTLNTDTGASSVSESSGPPISPQAIREQLQKTKQQLAGYSVRVGIVDKRDPRTAANRASIATFADTALAELLRADAAFDDFFNSEEYNRKWVQETAALLSSTRPMSIADIQRVLYQRLEVLRLLMVDRVDGFEDEVARNLLAFEAYDKARRRLFQAIGKRPLLAFEYVNTRSKDLPNSSTLRFIYERQLGSRIDLTGNLAVSLQDSGSVLLPEPKEIGGRRDWQLAGQMDVPLGSLEKRLGAGAGIGTPVLGIAFLSQNLTNRAAVSFSGNTFTVEPGWIHAVQARLTVPVKGSGVKVPLSLTYSNRTELLKEKDVRGQIGMTFDMDVLSSVVRR
jgi:hypothetical protein